MILAALAAQTAVAGSAQEGDPKATVSVSKKKLRNMIRKEVRRQLQPGPQGSQGIQGQQGAQGIQGQQGPAGTAPPCQGNGSGDTMVAAGAVCIDRYEASIWDSAEGGSQITDAIPCDANGQDCDNIFARSVPGVTPRADITWFQAQQALANVGKRLPTNAEWQQAVAGTPDGAACNVGFTAVASTGANADCISRFGANDMVGNLWEWVADWDEEAFNACTTWPAGFGTDLTCLGRGSGEASTRFPGALIRGGGVGETTFAGPFAVYGGIRPSATFGDFGFGSFSPGFRGAR